MTSSQNTPSRQLLAAKAELESVLVARFTQDILATPRKLQECTYALIDQPMCDKAALQTLLTEYALEPVILFETMPEAHSPEYSPLLVPLPQPLPQTLAEALAEVTALPQGLSLMVSHWPLADLTVHLRQWMNGELEDGTSVLTRYYDSRTGFDACEVWPQAAREQFLAPLAIWQGWDYQGIPQSLSPQNPANPDAAQQNPAWPMITDQNTARAFDKLTEASFILGEVLEPSESANTTATDGASLWVNNGIVRKALAFVDRTPPFDWSDRYGVAHHALLTHPLFFEKPEFLHQLERLEQVPGRIHTLLNSMPAHVSAQWQKERQEVLVPLHRALTQQHRQRHHNAYIAPTQPL